MKLTLLAFFFFLTTAHASSELTLVVNGKETRYSLSQLKKALKPVTVTIDDPVYKAKKTFEGFALTEVLALAGLSSESTGDEIVFTAEDGFSPNISFSKLREHKAFLTFREKGRPFGKVAQGKAMLSPAPFYVIWAEGKALADDVPWPYQLVRIEVLSFAKKYDRIFPKAASDSSAAKGFLVFKQQCLQCHSLNLQGGEIGPELNVPKNITEYREISMLRSFIRDASSFRAKNKMPSFPDMKDSDLSDLLAYLSYMKDHKILR